MTTLTLPVTYCTASHTRPWTKLPGNHLPVVDLSVTPGHSTSLYKLASICYYLHTTKLPSPH